MVDKITKKQTVSYEMDKNKFKSALYCDLDEPRPVANTRINQYLVDFWSIYVKFWFGPILLGLNGLFFRQIMANSVLCLYNWSVFKLVGRKIRPLHIVMVYFLKMWSENPEKWSVFPSETYTNDISGGLSFRPTPILKFFSRPRLIQYLLI